VEEVLPAPELGWGDGTSGWCYWIRQPETAEKVEKGDQNYSCAGVGVSSVFRERSGDPGEIAAGGVRFFLSGEGVSLYASGWRFRGAG
jgi:hypothetical protein